MPEKKSLLEGEIKDLYFARTGYPLSIVDGNTKFGLSGANGAADSPAQVLAQPLPGTRRTCTSSQYQLVGS